MRQFISVEDVPSVPRIVDIALTYKEHPFKDKGLGEHKTLA